MLVYIVYFCCFSTLIPKNIYNFGIIILKNIYYFGIRDFSVLSADTMVNMLERLYWRVSSLLPFHRCHVHAEDETVGDGLPCGCCGESRRRVEGRAVVFHYKLVVIGILSYEEVECLVVSAFVVDD